MSAPLKARFSVFERKHRNSVYCRQLVLVGKVRAQQYYSTDHNRTANPLLF